MQEHIRLELRDHETVIPLLANDTLAHWPPLTFFRGLVLELDGAQHDSFDISDAVVSPIANAARVFAIAKRRLAPANTVARLESAMLDFPEGADILREAADAFRIGLYYQTLAGARIEPGKLGKFDRLLLKTAFSSIQRFLEFTVSTFIPDIMTIERYLAAFENTFADDTPAAQVRFVVLDTETTGLDPRRDKIITIGALAVCDGEMLLDDAFEMLLKLAYNNSSVTVHGITRDEAAGGMDEAEALALFLDYLRDGVIVGHHIGHDIQALNCACERHFNLTLRNRWLDTMDLTLHLNDAGAFAGRPMAKGFSLDALCEMFGVAPHDRHTAGGDAFLTAHVFLRLLRAAKTRRPRYAGFPVHAVRIALKRLQGFLASGDTRLNVSGKWPGPCDHSPEISPLPPSVPAYVPDTVRTSSCSCLSLIVTVVTGISTFPWSTAIRVADAVPSAAGASFNPIRLLVPPASRTPSQAPSNSFDNALLGGGTTTFASPLRVS